MAVPSTTIWPLAPHTRAKHAILRRYLRAWQAILTQGGFKDLAYIDGFAGPGRYAGGEEGSPLIALRGAIELYRERSSMPRLFFLFVESDPERRRSLENMIGSLSPIDGRIRVKVAEQQTFEEAFDAFHGFYESRRRPLPPTFAFIDPFGWRIPFAIIQRIMSYPRCEVLVNFMYEAINRFIGHPEPGQQKNFDALFDTPRWRSALDARTARERNRCLHDLYEEQLRTQARVRFVRSFEMKNDKDVTDYYLFHCTSSLTGLRKMKEAMWHVDQTGEFTFSDATNPNQLVLFERAPRFDLLRQSILERFSGQRVKLGDLEEYVLAQTAFRETHYKRVLRDLELSDPPRMIVTPCARPRRRGTYADPEMLLRFA